MMRRILAAFPALVVAFAACGVGPDSDEPASAPGKATTRTIPDTASELLRRCDERAQEATVSFEPERQMVVDHTEHVRVVASVEGEGVVTTIDGAPVPTTVVPVRLRCEVQAQIRGVGFDIEPAAFQQGSFLDQPTVVWSWDVTPRRVGGHVLTLVIRSVAVIDGRRIEGAGQELFEASITVGAAPEGAWERFTRWTGAVVEHPLVRGFGSFLAIGAAAATVWRWLLKRPWPAARRSIEPLDHVTPGQQAHRRAGNAVARHAWTGRRRNTGIDGHGPTYKRA